MTITEGTIVKCKGAHGEVLHGRVIRISEDEVLVWVRFADRSYNDQDGLREMYVAALLHCLVSA